MLARQFGLSQQQTQAAVEALLPAFSQGLKRNASDPYGIGAFMSAMASGQHAKYFEDAQNAFSPQGVDEGNGILGHLFGSKDLSRAVAEPGGAGDRRRPAGAAADAAGDRLDDHGRAVQAVDQPDAGGQQAAGFGGAGNPLGEIIEQMMRQGGGMMGGRRSRSRQAPQQPRQPDPFDNPFGKVLKDMFGGGMPQQPAPQQRRAEPQPQQNPLGDNPLGKIFEEMMKGGQAAAAGTAEPEPAPRAAPAEARQQGRAEEPLRRHVRQDVRDRREAARRLPEERRARSSTSSSRGMDRHR